MQFVGLKKYILLYQDLRNKILCYEVDETIVVNFLKSGN